MSFHNVQKRNAQNHNIILFQTESRPSKIASHLYNCLDVDQKHHDDKPGHDQCKNLYLDQDYKELCKNMKRNHELFEDKRFPPSNKLLSRSLQSSNIVWLRPKEICKSMKPKMMVDGSDRFDINQGQLGDCWFLSPLSHLAEYKMRNYFHRMVPSGQGFGDTYNGMFRFRFFRCIFLFMYIFLEGFSR